jgi:hypothetical protein
MRTIPIGVLVLALACTTPPTASDASVANDAGTDAPVPTLTCGGGGLRGTFRVVDATTLHAVAGATVSAPGCTSVTQDTQPIVADLAQGAPIALTVTAPAYVPSHVELTPVAAGFGPSLYLVPTSAEASLLVGGTSTDAFVAVSIAGNGGTGTCASAAGLTVSVHGHPEIAVGYLSGLTTRDATLTVTNALGLAIAGPMPAGNYQIDASSPGCTAGPDDGRYFTRLTTTDAVAGSVSFVQIKLI